MKNLESKLFADDSTFYSTDLEIDKLISKFTIEIDNLLGWCEINQMDINWSKTYFMFITKKRVIFPNELYFQNNTIIIKIVSEFKLLGCTIDNKLLFSKHVTSICSSINRKLYSIHRLFYLSTDIKVQFMKTFILPYFDYCLSLAIYYSHSIIRKLAHIYHDCLSKLFNLNFSNNSAIEINSKLKKFNLFSFNHRVLYRLFTFSHKIYSNPNAPQILKSQLLPEHQPETIPTYDFRPRKNNDLYNNKTRIKAGEHTFGYFFNKFYQKFDSTLLRASFKDFKKTISINLNNYLSSFLISFNKFNIYS